MSEREEDSIAKWRRITRQKSLDYRLAEIAKIPPSLHQAYLEALEYVSDLDYDRASFQVMNGEERIFLYALRCHIIYGPFKETGAWVLSAIDRAKRDAWRKVSKRLTGQSTLEAVELFVATVEDVIGRFPMTPTSTKTLKKLQMRKRRPIVIHGFEKDHLTNAFIFICLLRNLPYEIVLQPLPKEDSLGTESFPWIDDNSVGVRGRFVVLKHLALLADPGAEGTVALFPSLATDDAKDEELALRIDMYLEWHLLHCYPVDQFSRDDSNIRTIEEHWLRFPSLQQNTSEPFIGGASNPTVADVLCFMKLSLMAGDQLPGLNFFSPNIQRYLQKVEKNFELQLVEFRKVSHFPVTLKASL